MALNEMAKEITLLADKEFYKFFGELAGENGLALETEDDIREFTDWLNTALNEIAESHPEITNEYKSDACGTD